RRGDNCTGLSAPCALAIGPRTDVDRVLKDGRYRAIVLRGDEQHCIGRLDAFPKRCPFGRRVMSVVTVLIVKRQLTRSRRWRVSTQPAPTRSARSLPCD